MNFQQAFFDELEKIAVTLSQTVSRGTGRSAAGHSLFGPTGPFSTRANLANVGMQHVDKRNIPPLEMRGNVPTHQLSRNQIGEAFHAKKSFESGSGAFPGFTPASSSGAQPLTTGQQSAMKARLIGGYRERHGLGSHVSDANIRQRMLTGNELGKRRAARAMAGGTRG